MPIFHNEKRKLHPEICIFKEFLITVEEFEALPQKYHTTLK